MPARENITKTVSSRYAAALFAFAQEGSQSVRRQLSADIATWRELYADSAILQKFLRNPIIRAETQHAALQAVLQKAKMGGLMADFIGLLIGNRRIYMLDNILAAYQELEAQERGDVKADIISAVRLTDKQKQSLQAQFARYFDENIIMHTHIDENLLGGMVIRIGNWMFDGSLRAKLNRIGASMKDMN